MQKIPKTTAAEAVYAELRIAIADLAKSVEVTVVRMTLRAKFMAAIADAEKAERARRSASRRGIPDRIDRARPSESRAGSV